MEGKRFILPALVITLLGAQALALPDPDGNPADMSKPVHVYILMGQSNMLGFGKVDALQGIAAEKYPYLVDDSGAWTVRKDVRDVFIMTSGNKIGKIKRNGWMSIQGRFGPEIGIGHHVGQVTDAPVLILKSCIGNRSLGWDLLPPGSEPYQHGGKMQPGYRGTPEDPKGNGQPVQGKWYAGCQYDGDIASAKSVLNNLDQYYPGANGYEVKGFFWWQGDKDMRNPAHFERYEKNLIQLIRALRNEFSAPDALFVSASLGQTKMGSNKGDGKILNAMKAVAESQEADLKGKVGFVYTHPLSKGGSSSGHYGGNPETYMNVGEGMGKAMVQLIQAQSPKLATSSSNKPGTKHGTRHGSSADMDTLLRRIRTAGLSTDQKRQVLEIRKQVVSEEKKIRVNFKKQILDAHRQGDKAAKQGFIDEMNAEIVSAKADAAAAILAILDDAQKEKVGL